MVVLRFVPKKQCQYVRRIKSNINIPAARATARTLYAETMGVSLSIISCEDMIRVFVNRCGCSVS